MILKFFSKIQLSIDSFIYFFYSLPYCLYHFFSCQSSSSKSWQVISY